MVRPGPELLWVKRRVSGVLGIYPQSFLSAPDMYTIRCLVAGYYDVLLGMSNIIRRIYVALYY